MAFLILTDYDAQIKSDILARLTGGDDSIRLDAERKAYAQAQSRLNTIYDVATIFGQSGDSRNAELVMCLVDMALYHIHTRLAAGQVPADRDKRYADAMEWLNKVGQGDWNPGFPLKSDSDNDGVDDGAIVQWGGNKPRNPYF